MSILDKVKIGNSVKVNLELSKDRLTKETIDAINVSSLGKISDFRITDGKGIGVVLKLSNGKEQWFFEDEIDLLDENGNVIKQNNDKKDNSNFIFDFLRGLNYENKNKYFINIINFYRLFLFIKLISPVSNKPYPPLPKDSKFYFLNLRRKLIPYIVIF